MSSVYLMSLGCDKNRVDGEVMIGTLRLAGYRVVNNPETASAIIINTCGFIRDAVQESLDMVFELAEYKTSGNCRALVIVGCMAERYKKEIKETIPEADAFVGVGQYENIAGIITGLIGSPTLPPATPTLPHGETSFETNGSNPVRIMARQDSEIPHIAYVKISEGCDNKCAYCTIPKIRGAYRSRPMKEIVEECRLLIKAGAVELVLVAQDTALYGTDIYGKKKLPHLLLEIAEKSGASWIRLMYAYPEHITDQLIDVIADTPQICKYLDMPIQHSEDEILARMGRKGSKRELKQLVQTLRGRIPGIALRTTLMVGFPGETEENFRGLYNFAKEMEFERMGAFPYSQEEGTPAAEMSCQIDEETKQERLSKIMELQQKIHFEKQREFVGKTLRVIVDAQENNICTGRTQYDAYESDAVVEFLCEKILSRGQIVQVEINAADGYDLRGTLCKEA